MSAPKTIVGGPGDGAEIWRQWHFALTTVGVDLRLDNAPAGADDVAMMWTFTRDVMIFLEHAMGSLSKPELAEQAHALKEALDAQTFDERAN